VKRESLYFVAPEKVEICVEECPPPQPGEALVQTELSAISPGTEMLAYRGNLPQDLALDVSIAALGGSARYPFKYGYACVGRVIALGEDVSPEWLGRRVFAFNPHESLFCANLNALHPVPDDIALDDAIFLPNMETAVNFVQDARPLLGESTALFGLGIVGLLTSALLLRFPLGALIGFDPLAQRREAASELGLQACFDPTALDALKSAHSLLEAAGSPSGADLVFELSGSPAALDQAIQLTGFSGRIVIGSWYAGKPVQLDLGGKFHRSRMQLISSQVSTLAPELSGRWSKARRFAIAWDAIRAVRPSRWITQRVPFERAGLAYDLLDHNPQNCIQIALAYLGPIRA